MFADTASYDWYADDAGHFVYQPTAPVLYNGVTTDLLSAATNPAGILQIDTTAVHVVSAQTLDLNGANVAGSSFDNAGTVDVTGGVISTLDTVSFTNEAPASLIVDSSRCLLDVDVRTN